MLDGRVLGASQVEYKLFGKPPLQREGLEALAHRSEHAGKVSRVTIRAVARQVLPLCFANAKPSLRFCSCRALEELDVGSTISAAPRLPP